MVCSLVLIFFFFNDTATTEIYTLSLHDALPIWPSWSYRVMQLTTRASAVCWATISCMRIRRCQAWQDRKSTRLNSSHSQISYAVFCLKKKKKQEALSNNAY